mmetsp:Transcript_96816/g.174876  ORF Transcript_96816/g.174876 Transcript_96816/m.174876 type:complete len:214 (+) Transcript_96816:906-1547(+)
MSARPTRLSPSLLQLRCKASIVGKVVMARRSTSQSVIPFPSRDSDFSRGSGRSMSLETSVLISGMPSERPFIVRCKCSRHGKAPDASRARTSAHEAMVLLSVRVVTRHEKLFFVRRFVGSTGAPTGIGIVPSAGSDLRRVRASESHSRRGHSWQMERMSPHSDTSVLSSHKLFRFGKLQSCCHKSSGYRVWTFVSTNDISLKTSSSFWRCSRS